MPEVPEKSVIFDESRLGDLQSMAEELFGDETDPRSSAYKRILIRPTVNWLRIVLSVTAVFLLTGGVGVVLYSCGMEKRLSILLACLVPVLSLCLRAKACALCLIRIYQRYAPDAIRNKCRFEPSCSQYMAMSIEKYGFCKGLKRGIGRLRRCNTSDGGYDLP